MSSYVPASLRRLVAERADSICEYCLVHEDDTFFGCEVEHIISEKHGGPTTEEKLAYACVFCNRFKGSDIASIAKSGKLCRFYNPRTDHWSEHFRLEQFAIIPLTEIGEVTVRILELNHSDRLLEREMLSAIQRYPMRHIT
jgi:hypothetical protein